jgi:hypothetical protein
MEQRWGPATDAAAEALTSNTASNACFTRAGFTPESDLVSSIPPFVSSCDLLALVPGRVTLLSDAGSWLNASLPKLMAALWRRGPG